VSDNGSSTCRAELALVGVIRDAPSRSGGEWVMKYSGIVRFIHDANRCIWLMVDSIQRSFPGVFTHPTTFLNHIRPFPRSRATCCSRDISTGTWHARLGTSNG